MHLHTYQSHPGSRLPHRVLYTAETDSGSFSPQSHAGGSPPKIYTHTKFEQSDQLIYKSYIYVPDRLSLEVKRFL